MIYCAPKVDKVHEAYKGNPGYLNHWKLRHDDGISRGSIAFLAKNGDSVAKVGAGGPLETLDVSLVLFENASTLTIKIVQDGNVLQEIAIAGFSFSPEDRWATQSAVYRTGDLYVLYHTSITDFKKAFGYKIAP
jgi:hypothetical protein